MTNTEFTGLIDQLLDRNIAFASWYFPKESHASLLIGNPEDATFYHQFNQLNGEQGFVFAPFRITEKSPVILLKPGLLIENIHSAPCFDPADFTPIANSEESHSYQFISKDEYLQGIEDTVAEIKQGNLSKVIMSRRIPSKRNGQSIGKLFVDLNEKTPNAMTYLVNLPLAGTWMGATPEVLLCSQNDSYETVSLAGTQTRRADGEYYWHTKDIEEQAFVSRYMLDVFFQFDIHRYRTVGPETLESGKVAHLKTSFFFQSEKINGCLGNFVAELHPTPAVCGLPKELAHEYIRQHEKHQRKYYTGYLGPWRLQNEMRLFVNLRCMEVLPEQFVLYVGGGITAKSVPEKEWEETLQKAQTLLSVIEKEEE